MYHYHQYQIEIHPPNIGFTYNNQPNYPSVCRTKLIRVAGQLHQHVIYDKYYLISFINMHNVSLCLSTFKKLIAARKGGKEIKMRELNLNEIKAVEVEK